MTTEAAPPVSVIIVTHNSSRVLPPLMASLAHWEPDLPVVVVDDASPAGPPSDLGSGTLLIQSPENLGFGACVNRATAAIPAGGHVMILNPDVRLNGPSISELTRELERRPHVGIVSGPMTDKDGSRQPAAWGPTSAVRALWFGTGLRLPRMRRLMGRALPGSYRTSTTTLTREVVPVTGHVLGGAMLVRRACWDELGGFDENFFLYWEDADICQRARDLGWELSVLPCTPIIHITGTSSDGVTDDERWRWYVDGARLFAAKHLPSSQAKRLLWALRLGRALRRRR